MNILGVSGRERPVPFKQAHWPGLEPREYRISQGHDSAAALVVDRKIVAAAQKHAGDFPIDAIQFCLREAGLTMDDVSEIAHGFDSSPFSPLYSLDPDSSKLYEEVFSKEVVIQQLHRYFKGSPVERIQPVNHHLSHAASAAFTSVWDECLVVINDAMGEAQCLTVFRFCDSELKKIWEIPANDSIAILYSLVTLHLGFDFNSDGYKIMGLTPYGDRERFRAFFDSAVELRLNHSRAERVHAQLQQLLGREVSLVDLFQFPTVSAGAHYLDGQQETQPISSRAERRKAAQQRRAQPR